MENTHDWWSNAGAERDEEMTRIDALIGDPEALSDQLLRLRALIGALDLCHYRGVQRVERIIEVIGAMDPETGTLDPDVCVMCDDIHRRQMLARMCELWLKQTPLREARAQLPGYGADVDEVYTRLGDFSPLKAWQVERLQLKILDYGFADVVHGHTEHHGPVEEHPAGPCPWELEGRLLETLSAIGGGSPGASDDDETCHVRYEENHSQVHEIADALDAFAWQQVDMVGDYWVHATLGVYCPIKAWLAASLAKTIRAQTG